MFEDLKKAVAEFKKAKSIAIFATDINTVDRATAIIALAKICSEKNKNFQVLCPKILKIPISDKFKKEGIVFTNTPTSKEFVVSVDYSVGNIDKVICKRDEESKKLNFVITPKDDLFNFDNVELISGGNSFDLIFSFGLKTLDNIDEIFKPIFDDTSVISITKKESDIGNHKFLIDGEKSYSEFTYEFAKSLPNVLTKDVSNILLQGVISRYKLLENGKNDGWLVTNELIKYGANLSQSIRDLYYSKDYKNFELQKKVFENVRVDKENSVVWSKVALMMDVDSSNLDVKGRILFNICEDFDIAFVIYSLDKEKIKVVFESNVPDKYCALELLKIFSGYGTKSKVILSNKDIPNEDFEKKFFEAIYSLFEVQVL